MKQLQVMRATGNGLSGDKHGCGLGTLSISFAYSVKIVVTDRNRRDNEVKA